MFGLLLVIIYVSFIGLGLPDSLLGSAWPFMYAEFGVPVSYAGIVSAIITVGTIISSLLSDRLTRALGSGKVNAFSVALTAAAIIGFSCSRSFLQLCFWAVPYGLGAGSVDAALNNYVAVNYASRHMSWLHCMWGVGAFIGPAVMGLVLAGGLSWNSGYLTIGIIQIALSAVLFLSLPLWKKPVQNQTGAPGVMQKPLSLKQVMRVPGVAPVIFTFFCYCALEQTAGLWAASYLTMQRGVTAEAAAGYAGIFFMGITIGRAASGFATYKLNDRQMIRAGEALIGAGIALIIIPGGEIPAIAGLILTGIGCAPIYPCIIHSTPHFFGADKSQAIIGVQIAGAYVGICVMPPLFGLIADYLSIALFPYYLLALLIAMWVTFERIARMKG